MCFSDAAENPDQSMENIRVTVQWKQRDALFIQFINN
jgi:hypothetical protein